MTQTPDLSGLSCPQRGLDAGLLDVIVGGHARQVVETLLERHDAALAAHAAGVPAALTDWLARDADDFDTTWSPAFGDAHALLLSQSADDLLRSAGALALRLNECGHASEWRVDLPAPARFRFGHWLLPAADALEVSASATAVDVRARSASGWRSIGFRRDEHRWRLEDPADIEDLPLLHRPGLRFCLSTAGALSSSGAERLLDADAYRFDRTEVAADSTWRETCEAALNLLRETADGYVTWVGRVLRELVPLKARPSTFNSGSERFSPGVICVSDQPYRWPLAEMLVHESTHQYLHIIGRLGPLDDGTDERLYFSPFRNKERPIFFIVVAYHAFANVLLFYRTARERGMIPEKVIQSETFANREETLDRQLRAIEGPLQETTALTPLGRALWEPLYHQLRA